MTFQIPPSFTHINPNPRKNLMALSRPDGFSIFQISPLRELQRRQFENGFGCLQTYMLENTSLLALVLDTAERLNQLLDQKEQTECDREMNPCNLILFDDEKGSILARLKFTSPIQNVILTKTYIFVCLPQEIQIYGIKDLTFFDSVPIYEYTTCFDVFEIEHQGKNAFILAYASPTAQGRLGLNFYVSGIGQSRFIDSAVSELTFFKFSSTGRHIIVGSKNGKVVKRFSTVTQQLSGLYKRSSESAAIRYIDCTPEYYVVCSDKGTVHIFKVEAEAKIDISELVSPSTDKQSQRIRESRAHATFKAVQPGMPHLAVFTQDQGIFVVISADNEYKKVEFQRIGGDGKLLSRWELQ